MSGVAEKLLSKRFSAQVGELRGVRSAVCTAAESAGCSSDCAQELILAIDEACQNIIRHGYRGDPEGEIQLEIERDGDSLVVYLIDFAPRVDPTAVKPRALDEVRPGGLGTHFIQELMDEREFLPSESDQGNVLRMCKKVR